MYPNCAGGNIILFRCDFNKFCSCGCDRVNVMKFAIYNFKKKIISSCSCVYNV